MGFQGHSCGFRGVTGSFKSFPEDFSGFRGISGIFQTISGASQQISGSFKDIELAIINCGATGLKLCSPLMTYYLHDLNLLLICFYFGHQTHSCPL